MSNANGAKKNVKDKDHHHLRPQAQKKGNAEEKVESHMVRWLNAAKKSGKCGIK